MPFQLNSFADTGLTNEHLAQLLADHRARRAPAMRRLWAYYRNPARARAQGPGAAGCASGAHGAYPIPAKDLAQACGLPARLRATRRRNDDDRRDPPEVVIENDIAWRIDALVDFAFGRPIRIESTAPDAPRRALIQRILDAAWEAAGGLPLLQDMALLGSVQGSVDLLLRTEDLFSATRRSGTRHSANNSETTRAIQLARRLRIELIEAARAIPITSPADARHLLAHIAAWPAPDSPPVNTTGWPAVLTAINARLRLNTTHATNDIVEIRSPTHTQRYERNTLTHEAPNPLAILPIVHVQNSSEPFAYEGGSDVEPLIPLQDELNTRLSDRAHRVTLQSFKMYLARGIEGFDAAPVSPGQVWATDNPAAGIDAFGGDAASPSEDRHIDQLRDAMDKTSGVSPVVLGVIREKLGHLSSENALRITFMGVLSKTARKRLAYGRAIEQMSALMLHALDVSGAFTTTPDERAIRIDWPDPLPTDETERLRAARLKVELGVPPEQALAELAR